MGRRAAVVWNAVLALIVAFAVVAQLALLAEGGADANSGVLDSGASLAVKLVRFFSYFTVQSNLLVMVVAAAGAARREREGHWRQVLRLDALLGIAITGIVFELVLSKIVHLTGLAAVVNVCFHYVSPWMMVVGWLLFGPRSQVTWRSVGWAFAWPVLWIAYTFAHGAMTGWYPYPFLDPTKLGYGTALRNTGLVVIAAAVMALVFKGLDGWVERVRFPAIRDEAA